MINLACPNPGNLEPRYIDNPVNIIDDIQNTEMFKTWHILRTLSKI